MHSWINCVHCEKASSSYHLDKINELEYQIKNAKRFLWPKKKFFGFKILAQKA
jgi:hypothetical protein